MSWTRFIVDGAAYAAFGCGLMLAAAYIAAKRDRRPPGLLSLPAQPYRRLCPS
jgi:hypothetical protein